MNLDTLAYPDIVTISGIEYNGKRNTSSEKLLIPYTEEPDVGIGDMIIQKSGKREIQLKVLDCSFLKEGTMRIGTKHPHMLTLKVQNITAQAHLPINQNSTINIGSIHGDQLQIGNNNTQTINITLNELIEKVAKTDDEEAKILLRKLFENSTVASIIGAGATAIFG